MSALLGFNNTISFMGFWSFVDNVLGSVITILGDLLVMLIFTIFRWILNIVDIMQILLEKLVGLDYWGTDKVSTSTLQDSDVLFKFILNDGVQRAFRWMIVIFIILIIVFTVIAIVKSEYEVASTGDSKKSPKMPIFANTLKTLLLVILIPIMLILGILTSNAILTSLVNALNVNNDISLGSQIFSVSAYSANRYRVYADEGNRYAASNRVNVTWNIDGKDYTQQVETYLTVINPSSYGWFGINLFNGFLFTLNGTEYLLEVNRDVNSPIYFPGYDVDPGTPFYEIGEGTVPTDDLRYRYKLDAYAEYLKSIKATDITRYTNIDLTARGQGDYLVEAAYNTWHFNDSYLNSKKFENSVDMNTNKSFTTNRGGYVHTGVSYPRNSETWGRYLDGGIGSSVEDSEPKKENTSFVPLKDEYYVMADIVDLMCSENVSLHVVNVVDTRIRWENLDSNGYERGAGDLLKNYLRTNSFNGVTYYDFMVNYSINGKVAYTPNYNSTREDTGAIYIMCHQRSDGSYVPVLNRQDYTDEKGKLIRFDSDYLNQDYKGLIVARGLPSAHVGRSTGYPTIISNQYSNLKEGVAVSKGDAYYADITTSLGTGEKYYTAFYKTKDFSVEVNEDWFYKDDDGNLYLEDYNAFFGDTDGSNTIPGFTVSEIKPEDPNTWGNGGLDAEEVKRRIIMSLPIKFATSELEEATPSWEYKEIKAISEIPYAVFDSRVNVSSDVKYLAYVNMQALLDGDFIFFFVKQNGSDYTNIPIFLNETKKGEYSGEFTYYEFLEFNTNTFKVLENTIFVGVAFNSLNVDIERALTIDSSSDENVGLGFKVLRVELGESPITSKLNSGADQNNATVDDRDGILLKCSVAQYSSDPDIELKSEVARETTEDGGFVLEFTPTSQPTQFRLHFDSTRKLTRVEAVDQFAVVKFIVDSTNNVITSTIYAINTVNTVSSDNFIYVGSSDDYNTYAVEYDDQAYYANLIYQNNGNLKSEEFLTYTLNSSENISTCVTESLKIENFGSGKRFENLKDLNFYDSMIPISITLDDAFVFTHEGTRYMFVPEFGVYTSVVGTDLKIYKYNQTDKFKVLTTEEENNLSTKINELKSSWKSAFYGVETKDWLITKDQLKINDIKKVSTDGIYDTYEVELLLCKGKSININSDANYIGRVYTKIQVPYGNEFNKSSEITADIMRQIVNNAYNFIINGVNYDQIPQYNNSTNIAQIYNGYGTQIQFNYYELTNAGVLGVMLDADLVGILYGQFRFKLDWNVKSKPSLNAFCISLTNGEMNINYNFQVTGAFNNLSFYGVYVPHKFNFIVFVFASIMLFSLIFNAVWGLISRIYEITMYFIVMPGVAATTPLTNKMFDNWKSNLIKKVLGAYGVMLGLNIFFLLIPPIKEASQIFTASDFDGMILIPGMYKAKYLNQIIYLLFLLVALSMIKTLPKLISDIMQVENVYDKGTETKKQVSAMTKDVGDTISGRKAIKMFEAVAGEKGKDGKRHGGWRNFVPGWDIGAYFMARSRDKDKEEQEQRKNASAAKQTSDLNQRQAQENARAEQGFTPIPAQQNQATAGTTATAGENTSQMASANASTSANEYDESLNNEVMFTPDQIYDALSDDDKKDYDKLKDQELQLNEYLTELNDSNRAYQEDDDVNIETAEKKLEQIRKEQEALKNKAITELNNQGVEAAANEAQNASNTQNVNNNQNDTNAQEAKFWADVAKNYADITKERADIAAGNIKEYTDEELGIGAGKKTRTEKKLEKAIEQKEKDKEETKVKLSGEDKEIAHEDMNSVILSQDKPDFSKLILDENSDEIQDYLKKKGKKFEDLEKEVKKAVYNAKHKDAPIADDEIITDEQMKDIDKEFKANQKANKFEAEKHFIVNQHTNKVEELSRKVEEEKQKREEKDAKKRAKEEAWNSKSGFGKFVTIAGKALTGLGAIAAPNIVIPTLLGIKIAKGTHSKIHASKLEKRAEARYDAQNKIENIDKTITILNDNEHKTGNRENNAALMQQYSKKLYKDIVDKYNKDNPKKKWNSLDDSERAKHIDKSLKEMRREEEIKLANLEKSFISKGSRRDRRRATKFAKPSKAIKNAQAKDQKQQAKQAKYDKEKADFEAKNPGKTYKAKPPKDPKVKEMVNAAIKERLKSMSGQIDAKYESARIKGRVVFAKKLIRRESIKLGIAEQKIAKSQGGYKAQLEGLVKGNKFGSFTADELKNFGFKVKETNGVIDYSEISKMSLPTLKAAVNKLTTESKKQYADISQKIESGIATKAEIATHKMLDKTYSTLDSMATKVVKKAVGKKTGLSEEQATGDSPMAPRSYHDSHRSSSAAAHTKLTPEQLAQVQKIAKNYMNNVNKIGAKYNISSAHNSNSAYSNAMEIQRIIKSEMAKLNSSTNPTSAFELEKLRQDLVKVKKMTTDMQKDVKKLNTNLSPVEAMSYAQKQKTKK